MKLQRLFIIFLSLFLITCGMRADGGDVLERIIRLSGTKGTVYSLLSKVSEQSGYLFVYDSKVVNNDIEVRTKKKNCTVRQAIYEIVGDRTLELKVIGNHILILPPAEKVVRKRKLLEETLLPTYFTITGQSA